MATPRTTSSESHQTKVMSLSKQLAKLKLRRSQRSDEVAKRSSKTPISPCAICQDRRHESWECPEIDEDFSSIFLEKKPAQSRQSFKRKIRAAKSTCQKLAVIPELTRCQECANELKYCQSCWERGHDTWQCSQLKHPRNSNCAKRKGCKKHPTQEDDDLHYQDTYEEYDWEQSEPDDV